MGRAFRIGIDLGGTKIEAAAIDREGAIRDASGVRDAAWLWPPEPPERPEQSG